MKKLLLILICLFVSLDVKSTTLTLNEWTLMTELNHLDIYVDLKNVETRNGFVYWYNLNNKKGKYWSDNPSDNPYVKQVKSIVTYQKGDCGDMKFMTLSLFWYKKTMGKEFIRSHLPPEKERGWTFPVPGTHGDKELKLICKISSKKND